MKTRILATTLFLLAVPLVGCGTTMPSDELVEARQLYQRAETSHAKHYEPEHLLEAKQSLARAEQAHDAEPQSVAEKHLAYIAQRKTMLAMAHADYSKARHEHEEAEKRYLHLSEAKRQTAEKRLDKTREHLQKTDEALSSTKSALAQTKDELESERKARAALEKKLGRALADLEAIAKVKAEEKRWIITLSGAVLFEFGKSELMSLAKQKLDKVVEALKSADAEKTITVYGHTDAVGSDQANKQLSQARADAVRSYLVSQGIAAERVKAKGMGEENPVANNDTPEGRANNRRVEIVVE